MGWWDGIGAHAYSSCYCLILAKCSLVIIIEIHGSLSAEYDCNVETDLNKVRKARKFGWEECLRALVEDKWF